ncbi:MAG: NAD(P)-dependent oxidoreductase [Bacteroidia bacterium]|nr:NAD(P)-dependent oxidoreductase [Bacteroidia bacterium]
MAEYKQPTSKQEFEENFSQIKPLMNKTEAYYESSRCLFCYDAPCIKACPTGIDIPLFIRQINSDSSIGAAKTIYDSNWFGNACGKVCPTEVLCEGACVYNHQNVKPIDIGRLQNYATNQAIEQNKKLFEVGESNGKKVAIIGAGPAGISCACELRTMGFEVDIFEAKDHPSGLTVYGVAPYKITNEDALAEMKYLQEQLGFNIKYNNPVNADDIKKLEQNYDAIFVGIGLGSTSVLGIGGEDLEGCTGAVEFIEELRMKHQDVKVGNKVIVLGGGNTAMDAASESCRLGSEDVILAYRRSKEEMGAYDFEYDLAKSVGTKGLFNVSPVEIVGNGKVSGVKFIRTQTNNGKLEEIAGSEFVEDCDMVIKSTGQSKQKDFLSNINGLEMDEKGRIKVNEENYQTTNPKYFAGGDAVNGGAEVVNGAYEGKVAAFGIQIYTSKN